MGGETQQAAATVRAALAELDLGWEETSSGLFAVTLPGTHKLSTACALEVGTHALAVRAFVARRPEQDEKAVHAYLLQRNLRLDGIAFAVDHLGDIHLVGRVALASVTVAEVDRLLGAVASTADDAFNPILERGFADSIRREWAWRRSRGESTTNLAAFVHLDPGSPTSAPEP